MKIQLKMFLLVVFGLFCNIGLSLCCVSRIFLPIKINKDFTYQSNQNGFKIKLNSIKNCGGSKQVLSVSENTTLKLTKDCDIIPSNACVTSNGFKTAQVTYRISKNGVPVMTGNADLCEQMKKSSEDVKGVLEMFGLPTACPIEKV